jgi:hypothetical protein
MTWSFTSLRFAFYYGIQANLMTNPPLFDYQNACGCWWIVTDYVFGARHSGIPMVLILKVSNPTHLTTDSTYSLPYP